MRRLVIVLLLVLCLPHTVRAQAPPPHPPPPCLKAPRGKNKGAKTCIAGTVIRVSGDDMDLRPRHGHPAKIRFTAHTVFRTNSGAGALNGIMPGDFACVSVTGHGHKLTAQQVVFDLTPFPCPTPHPPPPPPHH